MLVEASGLSEISSGITLEDDPPLAGTADLPSDPRLDQLAATTTRLAEVTGQLAELSQVHQELILARIELCQALLQKYPRSLIEQLGRAAQAKDPLG